jgi:alkyl hydroperoxide reductase subunit AhpC
MKIPIVADTCKTIAADYQVLLEDKGIALRGLFLIDPQGVLQQSTVNNLGVGRSVDEALRLLAAYQFVAEHGEVNDWAIQVSLRILVSPRMVL